MALSVELKALEQFALAPARDVASTVGVVSSALSKAARTEGFPARQLRQWMWIGSQYRLHAAAGGTVAGAAGAALAFLEKKVVKNIADSDVLDLNWVLETTVWTLCDLLGGGAVRSYLSATELAEIELRLETLSDAEFNADAVHQSIAASLGELAAFSSSPHLKNFNEKVDALFKAAGREDAHARVAKAALLYLAEPQDIVSDTEGLLGLVDDVYVIDLAYASIEKQTRCLPILQGLLESYPYVADLAIVGSPARTLDLYGQYVVCATLDIIYDALRPVLLVIRESGPFAILAAFFAAVEAARRQARLERKRMDTWSIGQPIVISDGAKTFKVVFLGEVEVGSRRAFKLGVDKSASLTAPLELAPYMSAGTMMHKRLSGGKEFGEWLKARHADPLINLTGASRSRATEQECVLLLVPRSKLDLFGKYIQPLGADIGAMIGMRYITGEGRSENVGATATDTPYIYACSDADTAHDLIRDPPAHVRSWRVVVDGARQMRALHASLTTDGRGSLPPICVLAELSDRETSDDIIRGGFDVWYVEDQDVQPPPTAIATIRPDDDPCDRILARQGNHWNASRLIHNLPSDFLEAVDAWMVRACLNSQDDSTVSLQLMVSTFMRAALALPVATSKSDESLSGLGRAIAHQAAMMRNYSELAAELYSVFKPASTSGLPTFERRDALAELTENVSAAGSTAVVCRSLRIAAACAETTLAQRSLERVTWTNLQGVRDHAPYDRIIVPGWIDRQSMRELASNGYGAQLDLLLYPFERRWFDRTMAANTRWERQIATATLHSLAGVSTRLKAAGRDAPLWRGQTTERLASFSAAVAVDSDDDKSDAPEFEKLEARSIDAVRRAVSIGHEHHAKVKALLVMFEEPGVHAFLPAGGKVIVLSGPDKSVTGVPQGGDAEKLLFRSVASLEAGYLLALPLGGDRDLVDARADQFINNATDVRRTASLWKASIRKYIDRDGLDFGEVTRRMAAVGVKRDVMTIRSWASNTATIAPRSYREVIPAIAKLAVDADLLAKVPDVLQAIDLIYRARAKAADAIVGELFSGEIDLDARYLTFELSGSIVRYTLQRIQSVEGLTEVPLEVVGRIRTIAAPSEVSGTASSGVAII